MMQSCDEAADGSVDTGANRPLTHTTNGSAVILESRVV